MSSEHSSISDSSAAVTSSARLLENFGILLTLEALFELELKERLVVKRAESDPIEDVDEDANLFRARLKTERPRQEEELEKNLS